jgi:hypothetical protein
MSKPQSVTESNARKFVSFALGALVVAILLGLGVAIYKFPQAGKSSNGPPGTLTSTIK